MPQQDPAAWREAREMWESSEMTFTDVAARLDVAIPTVTLRAKRELWVKDSAVSLDRASYTPKQLVEIALRSLVRAASQTKDMHAAVKASGLLLERVLGRVVAEAPPFQPSAAPQAQQGALPAPQGNDDLVELIMAGRFGYQTAPRLVENLEKTPSSEGVR